MASLGHSLKLIFIAIILVVAMVTSSIFVSSKAATIFANNIVHSPSQQLLGLYSANNSRQHITTADAVIPPVQHVVFIKTHKTGSSTVASVLHRYGYVNNLTFLVPQCNHVLNTIHAPSVSDLESAFTNWSRSNSYNILANHARYNRSKMDGIFHGANYKYITILRDPVAQFESMFYYFKMFKFLPVGNTTLEAFFQGPVKNFERMRKINTHKMYTEMRMQNEQSFDLGVGWNGTNSRETRESKVKQFGREFDLVMLTEYFDESLLLLRKLLGWSLDDIRYMPQGVRTSDYRYPHRMSDELRAKIRAWNSLDAQLYDFFKRTFWKKVEEYGPNFERDLAIFRKKQRYLNNTCVASINRHNTKDQRVIATVLKTDAPDWCSDFIQNDIAFTAHIRKRMIEKGVPLYVNSKHNHTRHETNNTFYCNKLV